MSGITDSTTHPYCPRCGYCHEVTTGGCSQRWSVGTAAAPPPDPRDITIAELSRQLQEREAEVVAARQAQVDLGEQLLALYRAECGASIMDLDREVDRSGAVLKAYGLVRGEEVKRGDE